MLHQLFWPAVGLYVFTFLLWLILRIKPAYKNHGLNNSRLAKELLLLLFYFYIAFVLLVTVTPIPMAMSRNIKPFRMNLVPVVHTAKAFIKTLSPENNYLLLHSLTNIIGNLLLFVPVGIFIPLLSSQKYRVKKIGIIAATCSFSIEFVQFISRQFGVNRTVDMDDIILNTCGALLGFMVYRQFEKSKYSKFP